MVEIERVTFEPRPFHSGSRLRRLHLTGDDKANDGADKDTYQSDTDAVDEPSQNSTHDAEGDPESVLLLVSTLICVTPRANLAGERDVFPAVRAAHLFSPLAPSD